MEIEYDRRDDHAVDILSYHEFAATPSQANNSVADQHTSLTAACDSTGTTAATTTITVHQTSSSESIKQGPSHDQQADDQNGNGGSAWKKATKVRLSIESVFILITWSLAWVFASTLIPGIIIWLVLAYMITGLQQFSRCDDYADLDDEYDTDIGTYRYKLVRLMIQLTGMLMVELLVYLALFRIGPFALRRLSFLDVHVWKWFLISIIVLVYFGFWLLTHIAIHKARDKSSILFTKAREGRLSIPGDFFRVHVLPILKGLLGVAVCGLYFLIELLIMKLVPPLRRPKILGLYAHKWIHALVYVSIGLNVSRIISASIVAILQRKHERDMNLLFRYLYRITERYTSYVVIGLRRSINFVLISIWLLVTWVSRFEHQLKPSHDTTWILRVGTGTLISLSICAILWLVKNSVMLWWKHRSFYNKFHDEVLEEGINLYLLGMICGQHLDVLKVGWNGQEKRIKQRALDQNNHNNNKDSKVVDGKKKNTEEENIKKGADQNNNNNNNNSSNNDNKVDKEKNEAEDRRKRRIKRVVAKARLTLVVPHDLIKAYNRRMGDEALQLSIYTIMRMVRYFLRAEGTFKKDINESIKKLRKKWRQAAHPSYDQNARSTSKLILNRIKAAYGTEISHEDFENLLISQIKGDENSEKQDINLQDFERWMERSHRTCFNIVSRLASEQRLAQYLNRVLIAVIIVATIVIWLTLVTGSTKAVSLLGGPLVALSFIFGETCSTFFKGIIFSYVIHPYGIGDICIINRTLYEVKQINIWRTTFLKVATNELVFCPNSSLFNETIIYQTKKKGVSGSYDSLEFILESNTNGQNILELKKRIDDYFVKEQSTNFQKPQVEVQWGIGNTGTQKVTIHFKHNLKDFSDMSSSECLQEMKQHREELEHHIMKLCADLKIKQAKEESD